MVLIAYRKATIALADEVLFLDDGRIADRGTHDELLGRNQAYARLVNAYEGEDDMSARHRWTARPRTPRWRRGDEISALATLRQGFHYLARSSARG